jgi:ketosteroid isomerase-like protein
MHASRPFRFALPAATLALALASAGAAAASPPGPLDGMSKVFEDAIRTGDVVAAANLYADDGMIMPPNNPAVTGRGNIAAFFKTMTDNGFSLKLAPVDSWMDGKLAVRSGTYVLLDKTQKEIEHGKWVEAWRKNGAGRWQLVRDMWNSSDPPPPPPPVPAAAGGK